MSENNNTPKNKSSLVFDGNKFQAMNQKNNMGKYQPVKDETKESRVGEEVPEKTEAKKKGRPQKGALLDLNIGINVFLDKPLHRKLGFAKAVTGIGIKDLIYMATDYVMNEYFENGEPDREGERMIRDFKKKMFGTEE